MARTIGLDIGSSALRAVQVTTGGRGPAALERVGQVALPPGAVRDGEVAEPDAVVESLRALWSRFGFKGRQVALGVANQQVVVRQLDLPYLPESELRQSLGFQVQDAIPIPVEQAILDFHVLDTLETGEGQRISRIMLVAAQRQMIDAVLDVVGRARLEPVALDLQAFAVLRSLAPPGVLTGSQGELLVDVGAAVTNIVIHEGGVPRFVRILLMGGSAITDSLVGALGMSHEQAERAKASIGLVAGDGGRDQATRLIAERAGSFVDELRGSLDYYQAQAEAVPVRRVVLTGGASQLPNLAERLSDALGLPVQRGHPMQELRIGKVGIGHDELVAAEPYLAVAIGLALGASA
ncbi:MAG TPA: type IV pilus assembly protein PilM [Egibacteraceae bacterium]|nr:type IV pilus assembly protein PilM [Actinomycetota bacterium]HWB70871.1 type IV pilus assembly protein PilM [Egibacteraceae bacterium]